MKTLQLLLLASVTLTLTPWATIPILTSVNTCGGLHLKQNFCEEKRNLKMATLILCYPEISFTEYRSCFQSLIIGIMQFQAPVRCLPPPVKPVCHHKTIIIKHPHTDRNDQLLFCPTKRLEKLPSPFHKIWFYSIRGAALWCGRQWWCHFKLNHY
jgi:hypothetical protein